MVNTYRYDVINNNGDYQWLTIRMINNWDHYLFLNYSTI